MGELTEMINQGGEAFLLVFLVIGALGVAVVAFLAAPKKFLKAVFKDLWNSLVEKHDDEHKTEEKTQNERKQRDLPQ